MFSLVGKKVGMARVFGENGDFVSATAIQVNPNVVVGLKTVDTHGYDSVAVGYGEIRSDLLSKPVRGQFEKKGISPKRYIYELKGLSPSGYSIGDEIQLKTSFKVGDLIDVQGTTRGHGFTGAIKLWNFSCGPKSHGAGYPHRFGGSLETGRGGSAPQKVWKGKKMGGRYGNELVTMVGLEVLHLDDEKNLMFIKGSIPGRSGSVVKMKITSRNKKKVEQPFKIFRHE